jgi:hypothetical protein
MIIYFQKMIFWNFKSKYTNIFRIKILVLINISFKLLKKKIIFKKSETIMNKFFLLINKDFIFLILYFENKWLINYWKKKLKILILAKL